MCKVTTSKWESLGSKLVSKNPEAVLTVLPNAMLNLVISMEYSHK